MFAVSHDLVVRYILTAFSRLWSAVAQLVECRTRNRESPGSNPVVTVSKCGHFLSLHDASVDAAE